MGKKESVAKNDDLQMWVLCLHSCCGFDLGLTSPVHEHECRLHCHTKRLGYVGNNGMAVET